MDIETIAQALISEGNRRRDTEGFGMYGDGLSREERDQWHDAAEFIREFTSQP